MIWETYNWFRNLVSFLLVCTPLANKGSHDSFKPQALYWPLQLYIYLTFYHILAISLLYSRPFKMHSSISLYVWVHLDHILLADSWLILVLKHTVVVELSTHRIIYVYLCISIYHLSSFYLSIVADHGK